MKEGVKGSLRWGSRERIPGISEALAYLWVKVKSEDRYILFHFVTHSVPRNGPELIFKKILRSERAGGPDPWSPPGHAHDNGCSGRDTNWGSSALSLKLPKLIV